MTALDALAHPSVLRWHPASVEAVAERIAVTGRLVFDEPLRIGNGDDDALVDQTLVRDADGRPFVSGASLAGALRALLARHAEADARRLFGSDRGAGASMSASPLVVGDAVLVEGAGVPEAHVRTGVGLDGRSRTAAPNLLYAFEAWPAGLALTLDLELTVPAGDEAEHRRQALASLLAHLVAHGVVLGARTSRGYGHARVEGLRLERQAAGDRGALVRRLRRTSATRGAALTAEAIAPALGVARADALTDAVFAVTVAARLDGGGLLIRTGKGGDRDLPDAVYLGHAGSATGRGAPVVSGTSLGGALRAHARRIAHHVSGEVPPRYDALEPRPGSGAPDARTRAEALVRAVFGAAPSTRRDAAAYRSRLKVREAAVVGGTLDHVQPRVSIDRFTGGAFPGALFSEQPVVGAAEVALRFELPRPVEAPVRGRDDAERATAAAAERARVDAQWAAEKGLLLLVAKDLATGLLPLGGTQSVGRGRLAATAPIAVDDGAERHALSVVDGGLSAPPALDAHVAALVAALAPSPETPRPDA